MTLSQCIGVGTRIPIKYIDEAPMAYKDIDQVMDDQKDLTKITHTLRQIVNYKGTN